MHNLAISKCGQDLFRAPREASIHIRPGRGILIVDSQGFGDVVQSLPLLEAVCGWASGRWPVRVLFSSPQHYALVQNERLCLTPFFVQRLCGDPWGMLRLWKELAAKSDLIVCAPEMSAPKLVLLKFAARARYTVGEAAPPFSWLLTHPVAQGWTVPFHEVHDAIASRLGIATPLGPPVIHLRPEEIAWAESELSRAGLDTAQPIVGIQCSSVVPSKRWPARNFGRLARMMSGKAARMAVISFGTDNERASAEDARSLAAGVPWLEATGRWRIRETLAMLCMCDLFISGDTGLMHMAAAVGAKTVSIFGPTSISRRAPLHNGGIALHPDTPCHPCFRGQWTPCDCILSVTVEQVFSAAMQCMANLEERHSQPEVVA